MSIAAVMGRDRLIRVRQYLTDPASCRHAHIKYRDNVAESATGCRALRYLNKQIALYHDTLFLLPTTRS